jgi:membrane associated rhomboid family serine protease
MESESRASELIKSVPGFSLAICILSSVSGLISLLFPYFVLSLACIPCYVISNFEPWRLATSPTSMLTILDLFLLLPSFLSTSCTTEKRFGTLRYVLFFCCNVLLVQLLYILLSFLFSSLYTQPCLALWGEVMVEVVLISRKQPDAPTPFLCCPGKIKSAYYPVLLFLLGALLGYPAEMLCGLAVGHISIF